ncbi:hypothetical protein BDZ97DRAFT_1853905 [Flammula alnicola]|nr:hypothetical protein BDZ97DRAFT_1853905 [Flammula alnicola]
MGLGVVIGMRSGKRWLRKAVDALCMDNVSVPLFNTSRSGWRCLLTVSFSLRSVCSKCMLSVI